MISTREMAGLFRCGVLPQALTPTAGRVPA